jgi:hypothetical protein
MTNRIILACIVFVCFAQGALAQPMHPAHPTETAGMMSEAVVRQLLVQHGYVVQSLTLQEGQYRAAATKDGRPVLLSVDARTGQIQELKQP